MDKVLGAFIYLKNRLAEPSTHAALMGIFALAGHQLDDVMIKNIMDVAALGFGVMGFFIKEAKPMSSISV